MISMSAATSLLEKEGRDQRQNSHEGTSKNQVGTLKSSALSGGLNLHFL